MGEGSTMTRFVGLVVHREKPSAAAIALEVIAWLKEHDISVALDCETAIHLGRPQLERSPEQWKQVEFIVSLGGDGTILMAARIAAPTGTPILGVHFGRLVFIAESHPDELFFHLECTLPVGR